MKNKADFTRKTALAMALWCGAGVVALGTATVAQAQQSEPAASQVLVSGFSFEGNHIYNSATLSGLIASEIGKPMTLKQIQDTAALITDYYHQNGYPLAKVVVPQQTFGDDRPVTLVVLEGQLGAIDVRGNQRYASSRVSAVLGAAGTETGEPIMLDEVERSLTSLNRQSGITASATLRPGGEQGYTDLVVDVEEAPRVTGSLEVNNYGSKDTGRYRVMPSVKFQNLSGRGDELDLIGMKSLGDGDAWFGYAGYTTPLNARGTSMELYGSTGNVSVGREFKVLEIEGDSTSLGLGLHQDHVFSARNVVTYSAWLESTDLKQSLLDTTVVQDNVRKVRLGAALDHSDLSGRTLLSADVHQGLGENLGGMDNNSVESSRPYAGADNEFTKLTVDLMRIQRINSRLLAVPRLYGQYAFDPLVSSEQFAVGGVNSVRGHAPSGYSGDNGFTVSLEGRYDLFEGDQRYQLISGVSHGRTYIKKPFVDQEDEQDISGFSLGVLANPIEPVQLRLDWGIPLGDKTEDSSYVYAQVQYNF
ncbi:ShlB/FhaC/HecB family hemolysin secretion/activation protein [Halomonas sp. HAL1]|uniref:ShlB/FhaC/HecB family hemolysin secretion/activation protein n=1 Tax=Halomonas sp. HAL1 TaxID=550984 RepID=UPI00022D2BC9|nr:ShlB/FhaC/HecB family hemolysin secretion/activation protein [Halomonas sp. HAL1]EHA14340.1 putative hemolysin activation/secretion protein [Halomonas sp. HAL1]WKV92401.1 ShlB/FhaC/HecB family hemolysin secretion/activation protein [Halomonas sp. HAL1]